MTKATTQRPVMVMGKVLSDGQWRENEARQILMTSLIQASQIEDDQLARKILEQSIERALKYLNWEIRRPDPEPGEERLWHEPHLAGEPCLFNHEKGIIE